MKSEDVRVRIAPSPTGFAHVGTMYTALLNLAFAKANGGEMLLRLEDTDRKRNVSGAEQKIYEAFDWLGIEFDESPEVGGEYGPYRQSERLDIYNRHIDDLLEKDKAYFSDGAVYLKVSKEDVKWDDLVRGEVRFPSDQMKDLVIRKSDGSPTYMFAVVVDDYLMRITHVIRGEDHISNTPKQIQIYKALEVNIPKFAHTPLLRGSNRSKLSKRRDNVEVSWYKSEGFLPEALINFMALLGWSHPQGKEIFSMQEFFKEFSLQRIRKTAPVFDLRKLTWMNSEYIKNKSDQELSGQISTFFTGKYDKNLEKIVPLVKERISTLKEFESLALFFYKDPEVDKDMIGSMQHVEEALSVLRQVEVWELDRINEVLMKLIEEKDYKTGKFFMDLRIAVSGSKVTPPINESLVIIGKDRTLHLLEKVVG